MAKRETLEVLRTFMQERDWNQFHSPENLAKSIAIEAGELLECFQWSAEADEVDVRDELADVLTYSLLLADRMGLDPDEIVREKLKITEKKYPVDLAYGKATKYTKLDSTED